MLVALILILLGLVFLLKNLGILTGGVWGVVWPLLLILSGFWIVWRRYEWGKWKERVWKKLE